jgi:ribosome-associated translation inhibitor RaiA
VIQVVFHNLEKSELAKDAVTEKLQDVLGKFPDLESHKITVTLSMENSPRQAGPDSFEVKVFIKGKKYGEILISKSAKSLYVALADLSDHLLEVLNRKGDKLRVRSRQKERSQKEAI